MTEENERPPPDPQAVERVRRIRAAETNRPSPNPAAAKRVQKLTEIADQIHAEDVARQAYLTRLVPPTNLPQKFLNQLMTAAAMDGNYYTVETLLDNGADPRWLSDYALIRAAGLGHTEIVRLLHRRGSDVHAQGGMALRCAEGHPDTVQYLRECGVDLDRPRPSQRPRPA